jgi:hypothetical protein
MIFLPMPDVEDPAKEAQSVTAVGKSLPVACIWEVSISSVFGHGVFTIVGPL